MSTCDFKCVWECPIIKAFHTQTLTGTSLSEKTFCDVRWHSQVEYNGHQYVLISDKK